MLFAFRRSADLRRRPDVLHLTTQIKLPRLVVVVGLHIEKGARTNIGGSLEDARSREKYSGNRWPAGRSLCLCKVNARHCPLCQDKPDVERPPVLPALIPS